MKKNTVIVILGPTASGKSSLAVDLAKALAVSGVESEIISADSRQVYKYLDIGTGKITKEEMKGIPHHMIDIIHPKNKFNVVDFKEKAEKKIKEILDQGKLPIICGGTGFYIDALTEGFILPEVKENKKLRRELNKKSIEELFNILKKIDEDRAESIDKKNKVRLVRAIEIANQLGKVPKITKVKPPYEFIKIGIDIPQVELNKKINHRVKEMFDPTNKGGLLKEIKKLKKMGISNKRLKEFGFEYNNPTIESVIKESIKYSKRQKTWWKKDKKIVWIKANNKKNILNIIKKKI